MKTPPIILMKPTSSPKKIAARTTVVTGSKVDNIDALVGPTLSRPAKKAMMAITVDTRAMAKTPPHPAKVCGTFNPFTVMKIPNTRPAEIMTTVEDDKTPASFMILLPARI